MLNYLFPIFSFHMPKQITASFSHLHAIQVCNQPYQVYLKCYSNIINFLSQELFFSPQHASSVPQPCCSTLCMHKYFRLSPSGPPDLPGLFCRQRFILRKGLHAVSLVCFSSGRPLGLINFTIFPHKATFLQHWPLQIQQCYY